jgi:SAM-dependent methyltransferase
VSVDYLTDPVAVFRDVGRVLRPHGIFCCTFSNRLFPTKAVRGWLMADDLGHCRIVEEYFAASGAFAPAETRWCNPDSRGDPLFAVWAVTR